MEQQRQSSIVFSAIVAGGLFLFVAADFRPCEARCHYVIVHTDMPRVEVDSRNLDGTWTTEAFDDEAFIYGREIFLNEIYAETSLSA